MSDHLLIEQAGFVLTATLNRPEKKNAVTPGMYRALAAAIHRADEDAGVRCLLIQANGDAFCAGNDLSAFRRAGGGDSEAADGPRALLRALTFAKTPIVAAVHGRAVGIGVTLLLHCDMIVVAEDALLSTPFVNLALAPEAGSSLLLPARIGHPRAFAMFALGEPITGADAAAMGLANDAVPAAQVKAKARAYAAALASRPPTSLAATKALMRDAAQVDAAMEREIAQFLVLLRSWEAQEAFAAFAERRAPDFSKGRADEV